MVRADINAIRIGARSNVQDGSVIHVESDYGDGGHPTIIGDDVLIGHMAIVHGCTLLDRAFVGMGAIVMDGCVIEGDAMLAAGAMLTPGRRLPARSSGPGDRPNICAISPTRRLPACSAASPVMCMRGRSAAALKAHFEGVIQLHVLLRRQEHRAQQQCDLALGSCLSRSTMSFNI